MHACTQILFDLILHEEVVIPRDSQVSSQAAAVMKSLLVKDPKLRLGGGERDGEEIQEHPFFFGLDWVKLYNREIPPPFKPKFVCVCVCACVCALCGLICFSTLGGTLPTRSLTRCFSVSDTCRLLQTRVKAEDDVSNFHSMFTSQSARVITPPDGSEAPIAASAEADADEDDEFADFSSVNK